LKVNLSEMDVRVSKLDASSEVKTEAQMQIYHDIIAAALTESTFEGVWLWGFSDRHVSTVFIHRIAGVLSHVSSARLCISFMF
jgi:GH35 family endo-1,4-beta-xylanase